MGEARHENPSRSRERERRKLGIMLFSKLEYRRRSVMEAGPVYRRVNIRGVEIDRRGRSVGIASAKFFEVFVEFIEGGMTRGSDR